MEPVDKKIKDALWRIYNRPDRPLPWGYGGNLPWDEPEFSKRMLREHLDQSHSAATRVDEDRLQQIDWIWERLGFQSGQRLLDVTCGPGLYATEMAKRGMMVFGIDFGPAAVEHAIALAEQEGVADRCEFVLADVRGYRYEPAAFDGALLLYGQIAVMTREEAAGVLTEIRKALKPGTKLIVELLNQDQVDKKESSWWFTDDSGLWGDAPFLHLGERKWYPEEQLSLERFQIVHLESGKMDEIVLCDQTYAPAEFETKLLQAGFSSVETIPEWGELPFYDKSEWVVLIATA